MVSHEFDATPHALERATIVNMIVMAAVLWSVSSFAATGSDLDNDFKTGVMEVKGQLGQLNPVQNRIFEDEILRQPRRFIQDYKRTNDKLEVTADVDALKYYLGFLPHGKVAASFVPDPKCRKCVETLNGLKGTLKGRLDRRGVKIVTVPAEDLGEDAPRSTEVHLKALDVAKKLGLDGAFVFQMSPVELGDTDTAHAEDHKYQIAISYLNTESIRSRKQGEYLVSENLLDSGGKVLTDLFADSGRQMMVAAQNAKLGITTAQADTSVPAHDKEETLVLIKGFKSFEQVSEVKPTAMNLLSKLGESEERISARSVVGIAVLKESGSVSLADATAALQPLMQSAKADGLSVEVIGP